MSDIPDWRNADPEALEPFFCKWMMELTAQGLHAKSDIAIVLAMQDKELTALRAEVILVNTEVISLRAELAEKDRQIAELRKDAQRYRWLRDIGDSTWEPFGRRPGISFTYQVDEAIDAALEGTK